MRRFAKVSQHCVHSIEHVATHHTYFIYDQQLQLFEKFAFVGIEKNIPEQTVSVRYFTETL